MAEQKIKEHPILFSAPMVRAILDGRKSQTRRLVKFEKSDGNPIIDKIFVDNSARNLGLGNLQYIHVPYDGPDGITLRHYPKFEPGDRLWVKETFASFDPSEVRYAASDCLQELKADTRGYKYKPSIFMPRRLSRITLEVTEVRVQRLQEISEEDAMAEGVEFLGDETWIGVEQQWDTARGAFMELWNYINGKTAPWASNPWVWAYSFPV